MKHRNLEALVLVFAILLPPVATAMTVQPTVDWDFAPYPSYYSDWATAKKFIGGERLIFSYDPTIHNVQQVSFRDYNTCNTTQPLQEYGTGEDVIPLPKAGTYYFICDYPDHCSQAGMLMKVSVGAGPPSPPPPPPFPPPPPPHHPPPPPPRHPPPPPPSLPPMELSPSEAPQETPSPMAQAQAPGANETVMNSTPPSPMAIGSLNAPSQGFEMGVLQNFDENYVRNETAMDVSTETIKASAAAAPAEAPAACDRGSRECRRARSTVGMNVAMAVIVVVAAVLIL